MVGEERAEWNRTRKGGCARVWKGYKWGASVLRRLRVQCGEGEADPRLSTMF